jgi:hypothetical protein
VEFLFENCESSQNSQSKPKIRMLPDAAFPVFIGNYEVNDFISYFLFHIAVLAVE